MEQQFDYTYTRRGWKIRALLWPLTLLAFSVAFYRGWVNRVFDWPWIAVSLILMAAGLYFESRLKRSYRCPRCGLLLGAPRVSKENEEYVYDCRACRATWRTRTHIPND